MHFAPGCKQKCKEKAYEGEGRTLTTQRRYYYNSYDFNSLEKILLLSKTSKSFMLANTKVEKLHEKCAAKDFALQWKLCF